MDLPIIDWELSKKLAGNNLEQAKEFLELIVKELKKELPEIKKNVQDQTALKNRLHKLHGALSYTGLSRLKAATKALEDALKVSHHPAKQLEQFESEVRRVITADFLNN